MRVDEVAVFYEQLHAASASLQSAGNDLLMQNAALVAEDTGIENPAYRTSLRLEMHRRLTALHDAALVRSDDAAGLASRVTSIADRYTDLDVELTGQEQP